MGGAAEAGGIFGVKHEDAGRLLETLDKVSHETRRARHGYWFPLVIFGAAIAAASPLYRTAIPSSAVGTGGEIFPDRLSTLFGFGGASHPWGLALFWLIAIPVGYVLTYLYYRRRANRVGITGRFLPFVIAGLLLFAAVVVTAPGAIRILHTPVWLYRWEYRIPDFFIRGLEPLIVIALAFFVLARLERSWTLAGIASVFMFFAILANLYDMENIFQRLSFAAYNWPMNMLVPGGFLFVAGLIVLVVERARAPRYDASS